MKSEVFYKKRSEGYESLDEYFNRVEWELRINKGSSEMMRF